MSGRMLAELEAQSTFYQNCPSMSHQKFRMLEISDSSPLGRASTLSGYLGRLGSCSSSRYVFEKMFELLLEPVHGMIVSKLNRILEELYEIHRISLSLFQAVGKSLQKHDAQLIEQAGWMESVWRYSKTYSKPYLIQDLDWPATANSASKKPNCVQQTKCPGSPCWTRSCADTQWRDAPPTPTQTKRMLSKKVQAEYDLSIMNWIETGGCESSLVWDCRTWLWFRREIVRRPEGWLIEATTVSIEVLKFRKLNIYWNQRRWDQRMNTQMKERLDQNG